VPRRALPAGTSRFGPENASLQVRTYREGVAAKAGHDLIIDITRWDATVEVSEDPPAWTIELKADPARSRFGRPPRRQATDGQRSRRDSQEHRREVLGSHPIRFRSRDVRLVDDSGRLTVEGELSMAGRARSVTAQLTVEDGGAISGTIPLTQSDWDIRLTAG
jgi:polyisoprenoid-binding protein YceI